MTKVYYTESLGNMSDVVYCEGKEACVPTTNSWRYES